MIQKTSHSPRISSTSLRFRTGLRAFAEWRPAASPCQRQVGDDPLQLRVLILKRNRSLTGTLFENGLLSQVLEVAIGVLLGRSSGGHHYGRAAAALERGGQVPDRRGDV